MAPLRRRGRNAVLCLVVFASCAAAKMAAGHLDGNEHAHGSAHTGSCGYNTPKNKLFQQQMQEEYKVTRPLTRMMRAHMKISDPSTQVPSRRALYSGDAAVRILADYDQLGSGTLADRIRNTIMPKAIAVLARQMSMKAPISGNLYLPVNCMGGWVDDEGNIAYCTTHDSTESNPGFCSFSDLGVLHSWKYFGTYQTCSGATDSECTDHPAQEGAPDTDFIMYVVAKEVMCGSGILAYAGACKVDPVTGRPVAGYVNFCPSATESNPDQSLIDTAVHELLHAMFFTDDLMETYIDSSGNALGQSGAFTTDYAGRKTLKTPTVLAKAKEIFNCQSAAGVPLENGDGSLESTSHWEMAHVHADVMLASSSSLEKTMFGPFTMAVVDDTGWYDANWDAAGYTDFGKGSGCDFISASCASYANSNPGQDLFCSASGTFQCSYDNRYMVYCSENPYYSPGCIMGAPFTSNIVSNSQVDSHCFDSSQHSSSSLFGFYYGENSRCVDIASEVQYSDGQFIYSRDSALCVQTSCSGGVLQVTIDGATFACPSGSTVNLVNAVGGNFRAGTITCPNSAELCPSVGTCSNDCNGNGLCYEGTCHCFLGFVGSDCSESICTPSTCTSGTCNAATGQCVSDAVSPPPPSLPPPSPPPNSPPKSPPPPRSPPTPKSPPRPAAPSPPPPLAPSPPPPRSPPPPPPRSPPPPPPKPAPPPPSSPPTPTDVPSNHPPPSSPSRSPPVPTASSPPPTAPPVVPESPPPRPLLSPPSPPPPQQFPPPPPSKTPSPPDLETLPPPTRSPNAPPPVRVSPPPPTKSPPSPPPPKSSPPPPPKSSPPPPPIRSPPAEPVSPTPTPTFTEVPTVSASVTLVDVMFEDIEDALEDWIDNFILSVSDVLSVDPSTIIVLDVYPGSVKADFEVVTDSEEQANFLAAEVELLPEAPAISDEYGTVQVDGVLVQLPPEPVAEPPEPKEAGGIFSGPTLYAIIGGGAGAVIIVAGALLVMCRRRSTAVQPVQTIASSQPSQLQVKPKGSQWGDSHDQGTPMSPATNIYASTGTRFATTSGPAGEATTPDPYGRPPLHPQAQRTQQQGAEYHHTLQQDLSLQSVESVGFV